jgi:hypothetical protein
MTFFVYGVLCGMAIAFVIAGHLREVQVNVAAVLADLHAQKQKIDAAIMALEALAPAPAEQAPKIARAASFRDPTPKSASEPSAAAVLAALRQSGPVSTGTLALNLSVDTNRLRPTLDSLEAAQQIHRTGKTNTQRWHLGPAKEAV